MTDYAVTRSKVTDRRNSLLQSLKKLKENKQTMISLVGQICFSIELFLSHVHKSLTSTSHCCAMQAFAGVRLCPILILHSRSISSSARNFSSTLGVSIFRLNLLSQIPTSVFHPPPLSPKTLLSLMSCLFSLCEHRELRCYAPQTDSSPSFKRSTTGQHDVTTRDTSL